MVANTPTGAEEKKRLREAFRQFISERDLTQERVAKVLGETQPVVSKMLSGNRAIYLTQLNRIEVAFGVPRGTILGMAGFVDKVKPWPQLIATDERLPPEARTVILDAAMATAAVAGVRLDRPTVKRQQRSGSLRAAVDPPAEEVG